jgi:hypothetical protein
VVLLTWWQWGPPVILSLSFSYIKDITFSYEVIEYKLYIKDVELDTSVTLLLIIFYSIYFSGANLSYLILKFEIFKFFK